MKIKNKIKNLQHTVFNINKHSLVTNFNDGANCTIRFLIKRNIGQFCYSLHTTWRQENQTHAVIYQALPKLKDRNERLNERNHWVQLREWKAGSCLHGNQAQWFQWTSVGNVYKEDTPKTCFISSNLGVPIKLELLTRFPNSFLLLLRLFQEVVGIVIESFVAIDTVNKFSLLYLLQCIVMCFSNQPKFHNTCINKVKKQRQKTCQLIDSERSFRYKLYQ